MSLVKYNTPGVEKFYNEMCQMHETASNKFTAQQVTQMQNISEPSQCIDNFLSEAEFESIYNYLDNAKWHIGVDGATFVGIDTDDNIVAKIIIPKLKEVFGEFTVQSFFMRKSTTSLLVHTDHRWSTTQVPYKTFLLPIRVDGNWDTVGTVTYDQYQYVYTLPKDSSGFSKQYIEGLYNNKFDQTAHTAHVSHEDISQLAGLTIEACHTWKPRSLIAFDSTRLHSSNDWKKHGTKSKWAITLLTSIDNDA